MNTTDKKPVAKKPAAKKAATKKPAVKNPAAKKTAAKKIAVKKPAVNKPSFDQDEVNRISAKNLQAVAMDIDRQMKLLAEIDTRVLIAKDQLAEFQEMIHAKISNFQNKSAGKQTENHKDIMSSIRETRDEATRLIKDSKAIQDTYESVVKHLEKGRVVAMKEAKKAELAFMKKLHEVEARMLKKAGEFKKNLKK
jgi:hypothetical protein